jgi:hypothetical protein
MLLRERRDAAFARSSFRRDPLHEDLTVMASGSSGDKIGAMMRLSKSIEQGSVPREHSSDILSRGLDDEDQSVRWNAIVILARHGAQFLPELSGGLSNDDRHVRAMSAAMVKSVINSEPTAFGGGAAGRGIVERLFAALMSGDRHVVESSSDALKALARMDPILVMECGESMRTTDCHQKGRLAEIEREAAGALHERSKERPC